MIRALVLTCAAMLLVPGTAAAALRVDRGTQVNEVKAIGEDVFVDGTAAGTVVVVDGNLVVGAHGRVHGAAVIGGQISTRPGGRLSGRVFHVAGRWPRVAKWQVATALLVGLVVRGLLVWTIVSAAAQLSERPEAAALAGAARGRPAKTLVVGGLAAFGIGAAAVVSALTVVGLAVAAALVGVLLAATVAGLAVAFRAAGLTPSNRRLAAVTLALPGTGDAAGALIAIFGMGAILRLLADRSPGALALATHRTGSSARP